MGRGGVSSGTRELFRIILWMSYAVCLIISAIYILLDCWTFVNIWEASGQTVLGLDVMYNNMWRAPLASCLLSSLLTLAFNLLTLIVLIKKSINRSGAGFGYGFVVAYCFCLAFFTLLCSLVLDGFSSTASGLEHNPNITSWTSSTTQVYMGTEVCGFICTGIFLVFSIVLLVFQTAIADQLGIADDMRNPYAGLPEVPTLFVPPQYKSDTPGFSGHQHEEQHGQYGGGSSDAGGYGPPPGYGQPAAAATPIYVQPAGYQNNHQYTTYNNQGYESEAETQGLTSGGNSAPSYGYRPAGSTF